MAVSSPSGDPAAAGPAPSAGPAPAGVKPAAWVRFEPDPRRSLAYRVARVVFLSVTGSWFRPHVTGKEHIPLTGPVILAPVHRSFADFGFAGFLTRRKLFFMTKDELWSNRALGRLLTSLGAFPVHREGADREALRRAQAILEGGQVLVLFPEGTRRTGRIVEELHEGAAFLAARTRSPIVPVGIGGSDVSMPKGARVPKPLRIEVVVGEPIPPPPVGPSGRVARRALRATTDQLRDGVQAAYDEARARFEARSRSRTELGGT